MFIEYVEEQVSEAKQNERDRVLRESISRCTVEALSARLEGRPAELGRAKAMSVNTRVPAKPPGKEPVKFSRKAMDGKRERDFVVEIEQVSMDPRGIVEIRCSAMLGSMPFEISQPVYLVNPPLVVRDDAGDIEVTEGEEVVRYREDPAAAAAELLLGLVDNS
jgi:hypothetical protein